MADKTTGNNLSSLEETLNEYLGKKAPQLPPNAKEAIVKFGPWITLVLLVLSLPAVLALFGLGTLFSPFSYMMGVQMGLAYTLSLVVLAVSLVLEALAIQPLMHRSKKGWNLMYYATIVGTVSSVLASQLGGAILGALISLYILFQVRSYYK